jgi:hypothetical protein
MAKSDTEKPVKCNKKALLKIIKSGKDVIYNENYHINLLVDIFIVGGTVNKFCAKAMIVRSTFYEWLNKYPVFNKAYLIASELAEEYLTEKIYAGEIDNPYALSMMRVRFAHKACLVPELKANISLSKKASAVMKKVADGHLCPDYAQKHLQNIEKVATIDAYIKQSTIVDEFEERAKI